jgi:hypothetical protein
MLIPAVRLAAMVAGSGQPAQLFDLLTGREREVLRLLAAGLDNRHSCRPDGHRLRRTTLAPFGRTAPQPFDRVFQRMPSEAQEGESRLGDSNPGPMVYKTIALPLS